MWMGPLGASRDRQGLGGVFRNHQGHTTLVFTESEGTNDSNEAELLSIMSALNIWVGSGGGKLLIEGDSSMPLNGQGT